MSLGEDVGLFDFGVPAELGEVLEGPGVNLVLSAAVKDFALPLPKELKKYRSKYMHVRCVSLTIF